MTTLLNSVVSQVPARPWYWVLAVIVVALLAATPRIISAVAALVRARADGHAVRKLTDAQVALLGATVPTAPLRELLPLSDVGSRGDEVAESDGRQPHKQP